MPNFDTIVLSEGTDENMLVAPSHATWVLLDHANHKLEHWLGIFRSCATLPEFSVTEQTNRATTLVNIKREDKF